MSDQRNGHEPTETNQGGIATTQGGNLEKDWDKDAFPTSAKPIFHRTGLLVLLISVLCGMVYYLSDHSEPAPKKGKMQQTSEDMFEESIFDEGAGPMALEPGE